MICCKMEIKETETMVTDTGRVDVCEKVEKKCQSFTVSTLCPDLSPCWFELQEAHGSKGPNRGRLRF